VDDRLAGLSPRAGRVLDVAAVLGTRFRLDVLAEAAEVPLGEVRALLGEAAGAGLVAEVGADRGAFRHDLLRDAVYDTLSFADRTALHHTAADVLAGYARRGRDTAPAEVAHHLLLSGPEHARRAAEYAREAATRAEEMFAFEDAARWYERAVEALGVRADAGTGGGGFGEGLESASALGASLETGDGDREAAHQRGDFGQRGPKGPGRGIGRSADSGSGAGLGDGRGGARGDGGGDGGPDGWSEVRGDGDGRGVGATAGAGGARGVVFGRGRGLGGAGAVEGGAVEGGAGREWLDRVELVEVLLGLGAARLGAGEREAAREAFLTAAGMAREVDRPDLLARAALGLGTGLVGFEVDLNDREQVDLLTEARTALSAEPEHSETERDCADGEWDRSRAEAGDPGQPDRPRVGLDARSGVEAERLAVPYDSSAEPDGATQPDRPWAGPDARPSAEAEDPAGPDRPRAKPYRPDAEPRPSDARRLAASSLPEDASPSPGARSLSTSPRRFQPTSRVPRSSTTPTPPPPAPPRHRASLACRRAPRAGGRATGARPGGRGGRP